MIRRDRNHPSILTWETTLNESWPPKEWKDGAVRTGHEEYPVYYHPQIQRIITNAVKWAKPVNKRSEHYDNVEVK